MAIWVLSRSVWLYGDGLVFDANLVGIRAPEAMVKEANLAFDFKSIMNSRFLVMNGEMCKMTSLVL
jgi:hypothetical protein